jgi:hypothetical protein
MGVSQNDNEELQEIEEEEIDNIFDDEMMINETTDLNEYAVPCINARDDEDDDTLRRRGKLRKKRSKTGLNVITFQPSNEPETQVAQTDYGDMGDSPNMSSRPSLVADSIASAAVSKFVRKSDEFGVEKQIVEHTNDSLKTLRMGLNVDIVECVFDRYVSRGDSLGLMKNLLIFFFEATSNVAGSSAHNFTG